MDHIDLNQRAAVELVRAAKPAMSDFQPRGRFKVEHWRKGKRINEYHFPNAITTEGKNYLLNTGFHGGTAIGTWYAGLIHGTGYTALAATDTYTKIDPAATPTNGWREFDDYDEANRLEWGEGAASSGSMTNSATMNFTIRDSGTVKGVFIVGGGTAASTKNDAAGGGTLWAAALFSTGDVPVQDDDVLKVTYTISS